MSSWTSRRSRGSRPRTTNASPTTEWLPPISARSRSPSTVSTPPQPNGDNSVMHKPFMLILKMHYYDGWMPSPPLSFCARPSLDHRHEEHAGPFGEDGHPALRSHGGPASLLRVVQRRPQVRPPKGATASENVFFPLSMAFQSSLS